MKAYLFMGALAVSATLVVPTVASAETNGAGELVAKVAFTDLDLTTAAGKAQLNRRMTSAIREVCQRPDARNLTHSTAYNRCAAQVRAASEQSLALALDGSRSKVRKA
jgi:UrcA family protein